jgi:hypothetical protein
MSEENNKDELRPSKMRGVAFPKAKYGVILAIIVDVFVKIFFNSLTILSFFKKHSDILFSNFIGP